MDYNANGHYRPTGKSCHAYPLMNIIPAVSLVLSGGIATNKKFVPILRTEDFIGVSDDETITSDHTPPQLTDYEKFRLSILDQTKDYPPPIPVITVKQKGEMVSFLTLKSFSLWQGKQKSKKTTALAIVVAGFLMGNVDRLPGVQFVGAIDGSVLYFDTEQGESYAARTMKLILKLADCVSSPRLIYSDTREFSPTERIRIIRAGIANTPNVKLVVIDGLVDLMNDFMNAGEGHMVMTQLLNYCSQFDIHIAGVLHQNKADKNARAHIGTIASQKCEVEITTEVDSEDKTKSVVSCRDSRDLPIEEFAIQWEKGSLPCICQDWKTTVDNVAQRKLSWNIKCGEELATTIFGPLTALSNTEVVKGIMINKDRSESTAKRYLIDLLMWGIVVKGNDGNYRLNTDKK